MSKPAIYKHTGGPCPVDPETVVVMRLRCGWITGEYPAGKFVWAHRGPNFPGDIIAWRVA